MLRERGEHGAAVKLFRDAFDRHPSLTAYRRLVAEAELTGAPDADRSALRALRKRVAEVRPADTGRRPIDETDPATALVEILLFNGDAGGAWRAASRHGCAEPL